ncbi:tryptophan--tRNA ligase [Paenibacillus durus]|uniref:Tryptophan--tRNA ligase n=1 Tax=Paenibacillus durus TaxID=44251 RepID=A0A089HPA4_PAEDU|nr:tryptophan--tRNA ligase [Paenibacillus durus]AIQ12560.1 tryptophan--tRNA ligase [Paenibacillus durus]
MNQERVLTGDRVTGKLHLGHYVGTLKNRTQLQHKYDTFIMLADVQALTTHFHQPGLIRKHLREIVLDYLAAGIDPGRATIFVQSMIPEIAELTQFYSMFVTVNSLRHNPTIKSEAQSGGGDEMYYGFLGYPVSQAADITFCKATIIPVGEDQLPLIELTRKVVRRFNELYRPVLSLPRALVGDTPRLVGTDGSAKMSKSLGNAILLDSSREEVELKMRKAVTDPSRVRKGDPGHPEICPVYAYHRCFRAEGAEEIGEECRKGLIGCAKCKRRAVEAIAELLEPMAERRAYYAARPGDVDDLLMSGTNRARAIARETMLEVREAMGLDYFKTGFPG